MRVKCTLDEAMTMLDSSRPRLQAVIGVFRCLIPRRRAHDMGGTGGCCRGALLSITLNVPGRERRGGIIDLVGKIETDRCGVKAAARGSI